MNIRVRMITRKLLPQLASDRPVPFYQITQFLFFLFFSQNLDGPWIDFMFLLHSLHPLNSFSPKRKSISFLLSLIIYLWYFSICYLFNTYFECTRHMFLLMIFKIQSISGLNHLIWIELQYLQIVVLNLSELQNKSSSLEISSLSKARFIFFSNRSFMFSSEVWLRQSRISIGVYRGVRMNLLSDCLTHLQCFLFSIYIRQVFEIPMIETTIRWSGNKNLPQIEPCPKVGISKQFPQSRRNPSNFWQKYIKDIYILVKSQQSSLNCSFTLFDQICVLLLIIMIDILVYFGVYSGIKDKSILVVILALIFICGVQVPVEVTIFPQSRRGKAEEKINTTLNHRSYLSEMQSTIFNAKEQIIN